MHTVEQLNQAIQKAQSLGFRVRHEWLGGSGGGGAMIRGQRWLFIDLALLPEEQLAQALEALQEASGPSTLPMSPRQAEASPARKSA